MLAIMSCQSGFLLEGTFRLMAVFTGRKETPEIMPGITDYLYQLISGYEACVFFQRGSTSPQVD